ncbi:MAG: choice-of-anchor H family protein [Bacteroidales bacterium]|nr:choice-of-anchor H family protein [Bacteroidales bacterium]
MKNLVVRANYRLFVESIIIILLGNHYAIMAQPDTLIFPDGLREPTVEELAWRKKNMINTIRVLPNEIAFQRSQNCIKNKKIASYDNVHKENLSKIGEENIGLRGEDQMASFAIERGLSSEKYFLPDKVDNTIFPFFPGIGNQGSLGSCEEFSSVYYTLTHMTGLIRNWSTLEKVFSPAWPYNHNLYNWGGEHGGMLGILTYHGCATMDEFFYDGNDWKRWCTDADIWKKALSRRLCSCGTISNVDPDNSTDFNNLKQMLANGYILNLHTLITNWMFISIKDNTGTNEDDPFVGELACRAVCGPPDICGHAMTVVGYNDYIWIDINDNNIVDEGEEGAFMIANSWGTGWGNKGFVWFAYDALKNYSTIPGAPNVNRIDGWRENNIVYWLLPCTKDYKPLLLSEITLHHSKRDQIKLWLGVSHTNVVTPEYTWYPGVLQHAGQDYAFDGTKIPCDGSFAFDYSDLIAENNIDTSKVLRWYIGIEDTGIYDPTTIKSFKLIDEFNDPTEINAENLPLTFDNGIRYVYIDHKLQCREFKITSAWWSDSSDIDGDGYYRHRRLTFNVDAHGGSHTVYARISCCKHPIMAGPCPYYTTDCFTINGNSLADIFSLDIGLPNSELSHGNYKVDICIYDSSTGDQITPYYTMPGQLGFEKITEDVKYIISSAWWSDSSDIDGDGYYRHSRLTFNADASEGTHLVYAVISCCRLSAPDSLCPYDTTHDFTITGTSLSDTCSTDIGLPNGELSHGTYRFCINIFDGSSGEMLVPVYCMAYEMEFETVAEDTLIYSIYSAWWSDSTDMDEDGYNRHRTLTFDVDASEGTHSVYARISCCKHPILYGPPCWYYTTSDFTVTENCRADSFSVDVGAPNNELSNGIYQVCMQVFDAFTDSPLTTFYKINEAMGFECGAEDTVAVNEVIKNNVLVIKIYPNPATDQLVIESSGPIKWIRFDIINSTGQKVYHGILTGKTVVRIMDFSPGFYIIRFEAEISSVCMKFIKQ